MPVVVELTPEMETRLDKLAQGADRTREEFLTYLLEQAIEEMEDIESCEAYQRRKDSGTLELMDWDTARQELGL